MSPAEPSGAAPAAGAVPAAEVPAAEAVRRVASLLAGDATSSSAHLLAARSIVDAERRGRPEFGFSMLRTVLASDVGGRGGHPPRVLRDRPARIEYDAGETFAPVALGFAAEAVVERAGRLGVGVAVVHRPGALGQLAEYVRHVADHGLIALLAVGAPPMVAPFGGTRAALGTNPFAVGIPAAGSSIVVDAVTSAMTKGLLDRHRASGDDLPPKVAIDAAGRETLRPAEVVALLPRDGALLSTLAALAVEALSNGVAGIASTDGRARAAVLIALETDDTIEGSSSARGFGDDLRARLHAAGARVPGDSAPGSDTVRLPGWLADPGRSR